MPKDNQIPTKYLCSITSQIMIDPVMAADGYTYEREAIEQWLQTHDTSPRTNERLEHKKLTSNHDKRSDILEFLDSRFELYEGDEIYLPKAWMAQCATAIKRNQSSEVQRWLDKDRRLLTLKLEGDSTALHLACQFSSPELIDILLKILKQKNQTIQLGGVGFKSASLNVLLEKALDSSDYLKCELLLKLGAEVEQVDASTQNTLLHRMVIKDNQQAAGWLLEKKAVLESRNREGNTPFLLSVIHNKTKLAEFLLKMKANPQVKNIEQRSPVLIALLDQNKSMLNLLVGAEKAALPPLHLALELEDNEIIKTLLREKIESIIEARDEKKRTPFYIAIERRNLEAATLLLAQGANPIVSCGSLQLSVLHIAAERGDVEMLKCLLQTKAADLIDAQNAKGDTPLHLAVQAEHDVIIVQLLEAGAYHKIKNGRGQTPLELAIVEQKPKITNIIIQTVRGLKKTKLKETEVLHQVVIKQTGEIADLRNGLQTQAQNFKTQLSDMQKTQALELKNALERQEQGFKAQIFNLQQANEKLISDMKSKIEKLEKQLQPVDQDLLFQINSGSLMGVHSDLNDKSLIEAITENNQVLVSRLLALKIDRFGNRIVDEVDPQRKGGPLYWTANCGYVHFIEPLVKAGADINKPDKEGKTPVYIAAQTGNAKVIIELGVARANVNTPDNYGKTPVYAAAENGHAEAICVLSAAGADMETRSKDSKRPVYAAAEHGHAEAICALHRAGANMNGIGNGMPVFIAAKNGHAEAIRALHAAGANMNDSDGLMYEKLVFIAAKNGHAAAITALKAAGADVNAVAQYGDYKKQTPIFIAAKNGHAAVITALHEAGANFSVSEFSSTIPPLYIAAKNGHAATITALHAAGVDMKNYGERNGYEPPVFIAAKNGHVAAITALKAAGANLNTPNRDRATPLSVAVACGHEEIINVLLEAGADASIRVPGWSQSESGWYEESRGWDWEQGTVLEQVHKRAGYNDRNRDYSSKSSKVIELLEVHFKQHPTGVKSLGALNKIPPPVKPFKPLLAQEISPRILTQFKGATKPTFRAIDASELTEELQEFLKTVVEGEQDKAEAILKKNPALALASTDVTDLSKRSFKNITALQYALWALDWHMWTMLLKYIPEKEAAEQIAQSEQGRWVFQHGVTANWENLIQALNQYVSEVRSNKPYDTYKQTWVEKVGGAQLLLPAHVINEYCHPTRSFDPAPDFSKPEATGAWRIRATDEGEWFSASLGWRTLGQGFAVYRFSRRCAWVRSLEVNGIGQVHCCGVECDSTAVSALLKTRQAQRATMVAQYLSKPETVRRVIPGLSAGGLTRDRLQPTQAR